MLIKKSKTKELNTKLQSTKTVFSSNSMSIQILYGISIKSSILVDGKLTSLAKAERKDLVSKSYLKAMHIKDFSKTVKERDME
jgi:hypothetical protein